MYNIRLEKTAGKSRFFAKSCGSRTYGRAAALAGRWADTLRFGDRSRAAPPDAGANHGTTQIRCMEP